MSGYIAMAGVRIMVGVVVVIFFHLRHQTCPNRALTGHLQGTLGKVLRFDLKSNR